MIRIVQAIPEARSFWSDINQYGFVVEYEKHSTMILRHTGRPKLQSWDFSQVSQGNKLVWSV